VAVDGQTSGALYGSDIQIHDVGYNAWANSTADEDGGHYIFTNSSAVIDTFIQHAGYSSGSRYNLTPGGFYELIMWPSAYPAPATGLVNLFVIVNEATTHKPITGATVYVTPPSGAMIAGTTNDVGTETFQVANKTFMRVTVSSYVETGYNSATSTITTSDFGPDTLRIELSKKTVTPVPTASGTPLPGEATVRPTLDTRTNMQKDQAMMDTVRQWADILIPVACLMTLLYMFGYKP
jgi:hypothetical protein